MTNFAKIGFDKPLKGDSTAIFASNHAKPLLNMFTNQILIFLIPGKLICNKEFFHFALMHSEQIAGITCWPFMCYVTAPLIGIFKVYYPCLTSFRYFCNFQRFGKKHISGPLCFGQDKTMSRIDR